MIRLSSTVLLLAAAIGCGNSPATTTATSPGSVSATSVTAPGEPAVGFVVSLADHEPREIHAVDKNQSEHAETSIVVFRSDTSGLLVVETYQSVGSVNFEIHESDSSHARLNATTGVVGLVATLSNEPDASSVLDEVFGFLQTSLVPVTAEEIVDAASEVFTQADALPQGASPPTGGGYRIRYGGPNSNVWISVHQLDRDAALAVASPHTAKANVSLLGGREVALLEARDSLEPADASWVEAGQLITVGAPDRLLDEAVESVRTATADDLRAVQAEIQEQLGGTATLRSAAVGELSVSEHTPLDAPLGNTICVAVGGTTSCAQPFFGPFVSMRVGGQWLLVGTDALTGDTAEVRTEPVVSWESAVGDDRKWLVARIPEGTDSLKMYVTLGGRTPQLSSEVPRPVADEVDEILRQ